LSVQPLQGRIIQQIPKVLQQIPKVLQQIPKVLQQIPKVLQQIPKVLYYSAMINKEKNDKKTTKTIKTKKQLQPHARKSNLGVGAS
jgi:hypothetical protein